MTLAIGDTVLVRKVDYGTGRVIVSWTGTLLAITEDRAVIRARFIPSGGEGPIVDSVPFRPGDVFTEYYFLHRWYNIFHVADPSGRRKGWYCNVTRPPVFDDVGVAFIDMALDLFAHPDGHFTVLDEEEFGVASRGVYRPEDVLHARAALADLLRLATHGGLPAPADAG